MKYFLRALCQKPSPLSPEVVMKFVSDGAFFEQAPELVLSKENDRNWVIKATYDKAKMPVIISTFENDVAVGKELEEIKFILGLPEQHEKKRKMSELVRATTCVFTFEIIQEEITDDCWEMLDATEAFILRECDGILFTSDNEFFDKKLKKIYKL